MWRPRSTQLLDDQTGIAERVLSLAHGGFDLHRRARRVYAIARMPLPPPPAAAFSITGKPSSAHVAAISAASSLGVLLPGTIGTPAAFGFLLGRGLVAQPLDRLRRWADEDQSCGFDRARKCGILREKAKPRMDRLRTCCLRGGDDGIDTQIAFDAAGAADLDRFADCLDMQRVGVGGGMDAGDRDAEAAASSRDAAGDFAAIGDEDLLEHALLSCHILNTPNFVSCGGRRPARSSNSAITLRVSSGSITMSHQVLRAKL